jgi:hypothetical protein
VGPWGFSRCLLLRRGKVGFVCTDSGKSVLLYSVLAIGGIGECIGCITPF